MSTEFDAVSGIQGYADDPSWSHSVAVTGSGKIIIAMIAWCYGQAVLSATYGGQSMSDLWGGTYGPSNMYARGFYLADPPTGSNTVAIDTVNGVHHSWVTCALSFTGVDTSDPFGTVLKEAGTLISTQDIDVVTEDDWMVLDLLGSHRFGLNINAYTVDAGQTQRKQAYETHAGNTGYNWTRAAWSTKRAVGASTNMKWTIAHLGVPLKPEVSGRQRAVRYFHNIWDPKRKVLDSGGREVKLEQIQGDNFIRTLGMLLPNAKVYDTLIENPEVGYMESIKKDETQKVARIKAGRSSLLETFLSRIAGRGV
jgi:hypothetical protein